MKHVVVTLAIVVLGSGLAAGQDRPAAPASVVFPGSMGGTVGTLAPTEPGNLISQVALEQGVTPWRHGSFFVVGFARLTIGTDTQGLTWNNRAPGLVGVRLVKVLSSSVLQVNFGAALAGPTTGPHTLTRAAYGAYWAGWRGTRGAATHGLRPDAFPGSFSAVSGFVTPLEPTNWVSTATLEQGAVLFRRQQTAVMPFTRLAAGADSQQCSWNNRLSVEGGTKLRHAVPGGVLDLGVSHRYQYDRISRTGRSAPVLFAELWIGWNPRSSLR